MKEKMLAPLLSAIVSLAASPAKSEPSAPFYLTGQKPAIIADLTHPQPAGPARSWIYHICRYTRSPDGKAFDGVVEIYRSTPPISPLPSMNPAATLDTPAAPCRDIIINSGEILILRNNNGPAIATYEFMGG